MMATKEESLTLAIASPCVYFVVLIAAAIMGAVGCAPPKSVGSPAVDPVAEAYERAKLEVASDAGDVDVQSDAREPIGDACDQCGETGEASDSGDCGLCRGDGHVTRNDRWLHDQGQSSETPDEEPAAKGPPEDAPDEEPRDPIAVGSEPGRIVLHYSAATKNGWPNEWYYGQARAFRDQGWKVSLQKHLNADLPAAYLEIKIGEETFDVHEPITVDDLAAAAGDAESQPVECDNPVCLCYDCGCHDCGHGCECMEAAE